MTATVEGVSGSTTVTVVVSVAAVQVAPPSASLVEGDTLRFVATVIGTGGLNPTNGAVTWTSRDTARASVSNTGLVTARLPGPVGVIATAGSAADTSLVTVAARVATVMLEPPIDSAAMGRDRRFRVTLRDARGATLQRPVTWGLSDLTKAIFLAGRTDSTAIIRLLLPGTFAVAAAADGVADTAQLTILPVTYREIAVAEYASCALTVDSLAYCWGGSVPPALADTTQRLAKLGTSWAGALCGILASGSAYCGFPSLQSLQAPVPGGHSFASISSGASHACGVAAGDGLCWGANGFGQLGTGDTVYRASPTPVLGSHGFVALAPGGAHTCGLDVDGAAFCWGGNGAGNLGSGDTVAFSKLPVPVSGALVFTALAAGFSHTCGLTAAGEAYCWGGNHAGQLGTGDSTNRTAPAAVQGGLAFSQLAAALGYTCGITDLGAAFCWGDGSGGQLGTGSVASQPQPTPVSGQLEFASIATSSFHACGKTTTGVYCWGIGPLGSPPTTGSTTPVRVVGQP